MRGHQSGSSPMAPGRSCSPSNMKVSASAAMSSSDRVWPFSSYGSEMSHGPPGATGLWPNPIHGHHCSPMATTIPLATSSMVNAAHGHHCFPPLATSICPNPSVATSIPLVYGKHFHGHHHPLDHLHAPMATTPDPQPHLGEQQEVDEVHAVSPVAVQPGLVAQVGKGTAPVLHHISSEGMDSGTSTGKAPAIRGEAVEPPRVEKWLELAPDHQ